MRRSIQISQKPQDEIGNPFSIAVVSPFPKLPSTKQSKLVDGALNIRNTITTIRHPMYAQDYADLMAKAPQRQSQIQDMGKRLPASMLLTSWVHAPFSDLQLWSDPERKHKTALLQPIVGCIPVIPVPRRGTLDPQIGVVWKDGEGDGYWFTANLEGELWRGILDISL